MNWLGLYYCGLEDLSCKNIKPERRENEGMLTFIKEQYLMIGNFRENNCTIKYIA
jgi:hypothetical protein